ncbi:MAG TPA: hypothetical protein VGO53_09145 [Steroidobacteraceae bacterium]|nr:hypothetical protein [Steroidobacteraceae bacterium]
MSMAVFLAVTVRSGFRLEGRLLDEHRQAQPHHHVIEHVVVRVTEPVWPDLHRHMAIAQVVRGAGKEPAFRLSHGGNRLERRYHFDDRAVFGQQQVSAA